jgi:hypothetical protein
MQNVMKSVPRKSTTMGRTLDLPLEASILNSPFPLRDPLRAVAGIEAPEKGSAGRGEWKAAEELWQEDGKVPASVRAARECAIFDAAFLSPPFQGGVARSAGVVFPSCPQGGVAA